MVTSNPLDHAYDDLTMHRVERLVALFSLERRVYLLITTLSLVMMFGLIIWIMWQSGADLKVEQLAILFGPTGLIGYSVSRILKMFDQATKIVLTSLGKEERS